MKYPSRGYISIWYQRGSFGCVYYPTARISRHLYGRWRASGALGRSRGWFLRDGASPKVRGLGLKPITVVKNYWCILNGSVLIRSVLARLYRVFAQVLWGWWFGGGMYNVFDSKFGDSGSDSKIKSLG